MGLFASGVAGVRATGQLIVLFVTLFVPWSLVLAQPGSFRDSPQSSAIVVQSGYLFLNGSYVDPPYRIEANDDTVTVNDQVLRPVDFGFTESETSEFRPMMARRGPKSGMRRGRSMRYSGNEMGHAGYEMRFGLFGVLGTLRVGDVLVLKEGSSPLMLLKSREGQDLLATLVGETASTKDEALEAQSTVPVTSLADREVWAHLVSGFKPSDSFLTRANADLESQRQVQQSNGDKAAANAWSHQIAYPLTVFAMVIVVLAFGHLLSHKPAVESTSNAGPDDKHVRTTVIRSLLIVGLLSAVDLVWTIVASQTGSMRELNPIGNHLIHDPLQLALFKIIAVSTSIGLLYWLHQRPVAQVASWWSCLLLTLVTARWLTFNAMFL